MMQYFLYTLFLVIFQAGIAVSHGDDAEGERFLRDCSALSRCGEIDIKFPFSLDSSPSYCSPPGMQLSCTNNKTLQLLSLSNIGTVEVTSITYDEITLIYPTMSIKFNEYCPLRKLISIDLTTSPYDIDGGDFHFLNCSTNITLSNRPDIKGPVSCLSDEQHFVYMAPASMQMVDTPSGCYGVPRISFRISFPSKQWVQDSTHMPVLNLSWRSDMSSTCLDCYDEGKPCIYIQRKNKLYCTYHQGSQNQIKIIGLSIGGFLLFTVVVGILYKVAKSYKEDKALQKVEKFLENYWSTAPTRYTYAEVIKIAKRFKHKLGEGGFGSVYKGELPNGIPVAVKLLEKFIREGEDFINEVSTIGTIHHFNIVRLLGFCAEGSRRALIYEYMPNESLAKRIFYGEGNDHKALSIEKIQDIAIGIARGIEYLHQGCAQRILHFDIKPHNILLDYNFKPKIADFGLAKLCSKEQSIVTMAAVRGTMGYIAPELYSRNFGTVSYKSNVYSFGMLLLEMTGRRKNLDPDVKNQSQIYFPEWIYDQLLHDDQVFKMTFKLNEKMRLL